MALEPKVENIAEEWNKPNDEVDSQIAGHLRLRSPAHAQLICQLHVIHAHGRGEEVTNAWNNADYPIKTDTYTRDPELIIHQAREAPRALQRLLLIYRQIMFGIEEFHVGRICR